MPKTLFAAVCCCVLTFGAYTAHAQVSIDVPENFAGFSSAGIYEIVSNLVSIVIGFLGLLLILIILVAGFQWMTSGGNEDKIAAAKKSIISAVIGLVVILVAYAAAAFVVRTLQQAI